MTRAVESLTARTIRGTGALTAPRFPHVAVLLGFLLACNPRPDSARSDTRSPAAASPTNERADSIDLLRDLTPQDTGNLIRVVVEIPAGTNEKWEVDKTSGRLIWTEQDGRPRVVAYLPYPGNYGFVPRTLLPRELGGDGDPLDVLVLGSAVPRGTVLSARLVGVIRLVDRGETDDKLIAIDPTGPLGTVTSLGDLEQRHPAALRIVSEWFAHYKGPGLVEVHRAADRATADSLLQAAIAAFQP